MQLPAEAAAEGGHLHSDPVERHREQGGQRLANLEGSLRAHGDHKLTVLGECGDGGPALDVALVDAGGPNGGGDHGVGIREGVVDVEALYHGGLVDVALARHHRGRALGHGRLEAHRSRPGIDQFRGKGGRGRLGRLQIGGRDESYGLAHVADVVAGQDGLVLLDDAHPHLRDIGGGEHAANPGGGGRRRDVQFGDPRRRRPGPHNHAHQRVGGREILRISGPSRSLGAGVGAPAVLDMRWRCHDSPPRTARRAAAAMTAAMIG